MEYQEDSDKTINKNQEQPWYQERWDIQPMEETKAKELLYRDDEITENLEPKEIGNIQKTMELNPGAFSEAQREKIKNLSWKMIDKVANGDFLLDPRECKHFKYMMDNIPVNFFDDENKRKILKAAEQKWHEANTMTGERKLFSDEEIKEALRNGRIKNNVPQIKKRKAEEAAAQTQETDKVKSSPKKNIAKTIKQLRGIDSNIPRPTTTNQNTQQRTISQLITPPSHTR